MNLDELHVIVRGRVQGVGFRDAVQEQAITLLLSGWVRNLADGGVQVYARGAADAVNTLRGWLAIGAAPARVDTVEDLPATGKQRALSPADHFIRLPTTSN
ncbi:MAG: acylphosphatase [Burkholderiaceae bacterium]